jgi:hypothetical protein
MEAASSSEATRLLQSISLFLCADEDAETALQVSEACMMDAVEVFTREVGGRAEVQVLAQEAVASRALDFPHIFSAPHLDVPARQNAAISVRFSSAGPWFTDRIYLINYFPLTFEYSEIVP